MKMMNKTMQKTVWYGLIWINVKFCLCVCECKVVSLNPGTMFYLVKLSSIWM